jgi:aminoglycoside phosphotransferase (APT) family kinase protein
MKPEIETISEKLITYLRDQLNTPLIDIESPLKPLQGGFETQIYYFQLKNAPGEFSKPLVLRLYPEFYGTGNATWESGIQKVLVAEGYPVAQVHLVCTDMSILGGAFFIMDFFPGKPMVTLPMEAGFQLLGSTHAALHKFDPKPLIKSLVDQGTDESMLYLSNRFEGLKVKARNFPWLRDAVGWLLDNRPPEPENLAVCHGDFHALNILVKDGAVSGVLDWAGFIIADPAMDIATTIVLTTIPFKHLAPTLGLDVSNVDFDVASDLYLDAYRAVKPYDEGNLSYYRVRRCVNSLIQGAEGQKVWQHPGIVQDLLEFIQSATGIQITIPG